VATDKIILQGGGEHAKVVLDGLLSDGAQVIAIFDPKYSGHLYGVPQRGTYDPAFTPEAKAIIAIGDNATRKRVALESKHNFISFIHSSAAVSKHARLGAGNMIMQGVVIQTDTIIGHHVIINTSASVDHDCVIEDYVHVAPGAILCGRVQVGEGALIGAGAVILPGISVGRWSIVGAGAVVTHDVSSEKIVAGNPARVIKKS
jgi:sugar O-acyltransferase (sialic acid O-acetyltransferase NeuD family)